MSKECRYRSSSCRGCSRQLSRLAALHCITETLRHSESIVWAHKTPLWVLPARRAFRRPRCLSLLDLNDDLLLSIFERVVDSNASFPAQIKAWTCLLLVCKHLYRVGMSLRLEVPAFFCGKFFMGMSMDQQVESPNMSPQVPHPPSCYC